MRSRSPVVHSLVVVLALVLFASIGPRRAWAVDTDVLLSTETRAGTDASLPAREGRMWVAKDRLRMELASPDPSVGRTTLIFRAPEKLYWLLDTKHEAYVQIDEDEITRLGIRLRRARAQMQERLATAPPEQRKAMEEMLAAITPPAPGSRPREEARRTDRVETVDGRKARVYEIVLREDVVGEAWVVPWKDMELERSHFDVFRDLAEFQRNMLGTLGTFGGVDPGTEPFEVFELVGGVPLVLRRLEGGRVDSETRFTRLEETPHDPDRYTIPDGYERQAGPGQAQ